MQYTFSANLRFYRERKEITKEELARRLHVSPCTIWRWENDERYPRLNTVYDIAKILGVEVFKLVGESKYIPD